MTDRREIPDTPLFDRELNRQGYALNKFAMSLGRPDNRAAFKAAMAPVYARFVNTPDLQRLVKAAQDSK